jgi:hypothetical protein
VLNTIGIVNHWDPYPFILLNLAFSTQAAYAAPLILLAQNRQDDRDRANIERDREVAARTQADTEFLARELAAVRLALADVVTTKDLEDSMEQMAKLIADQLRGSPGSLTPPDGQRQARDGQARRGDGRLRGEPLDPVKEFGPAQRLVPVRQRRPAWFGRGQPAQHGKKGSPLHVPNVHRTSPAAHCPRRTCAPRR